MTMPGFTAEGSLSGNKHVNYRIGNTAVSSEQRVFPQMDITDFPLPWHFPNRFPGITCKRIMGDIICYPGFGYIP